MTKLDLIDIYKVYNLSEHCYYHFANSETLVEHFYRKYLNNIELVTDNDDVLLKADSPFGPGKILILFTGGWYIEASEEMGSIADFISRMFPLMSSFGAHHTVLAEYFGLRDYWNANKGKMNLIDELEIVTALAHKYGRAEYENLNGFRIDAIGFYETGDVHYTELHKVVYHELPDVPVIENISHLLCPSYARNFISHIYGVQKIERPIDCERMYFAENPLQQALLSDHVDAPVFIRPDQESYFHNDYNRLVEGKEVILTKKVIPGPFEVEKLSHEKFERDENVDFFSFYEEEMPKEKDWEKNELYKLLRLELISQKLLMAEYLRKHGIEVIPYPG